MIKVSCVLPVYNAEKYLNDTLRLLLNQTLYDIEVIFVNDCSSDSTWDILKEKQEIDKRIIIINELEHRGAAVCRNIGLGKAQGEYIIFLDADDYFFPNMLEEAYCSAVNKEADLLVFGYEEARITVDENGNEIIAEKIIHKNRFEEIFRSEVNIGTIKKTEVIPWNKMVKRALLDEKKIFFQDIPSNNDVFFAIAVTLQARKVVISDSILIRYYYGRNNSLSFNRFNKKNYIIAAYSYLLEYVYEEQVDNISPAEMLNYILDCIASYFALPEYTMRVKEDTYMQLLTNKFLMNAVIENIKRKSLFGHNYIFAKAILNKENIIGINNYIYYLKSIIQLINQAQRDDLRIALWGCGVLGKRFLDMLSDANIRIDYVLDSDKEKQGTRYGIYKVYDYHSIKDKINIVLVLNSKYINDIKKAAVGKMIIDVSKL